MKYLLRILLTFAIVGGVLAFALYVYTHVSIFKIVNASGKAMSNIRVQVADEI